MTSAPRIRASSATLTGPPRSSRTGWRRGASRRHSHSDRQALQAAHQAARSRCARGPALLRFAGAGPSGPRAGGTWRAATIVYTRNVEYAGWAAW